LKLKYQLLLLALLSLLFPITGWFALKSVDQEFRISIEQASKNTLTSLKASAQQIIQNNSDIGLQGFVPAKVSNFLLDGDDTEWRTILPYQYKNKNEKLSIKIGFNNSNILMLIDSNDASKDIDLINTDANDHIIVALASDRGLYKFHIQRQAEGIIVKTTDAYSGSLPEYRAYWHEKAVGYLLEVQFNNRDYHHLGVASVNVGTIKNTAKLVTGTFQPDSDQTLTLKPLLLSNQVIQNALNNITPENNHFIIKDKQQRIIYQTDKLPNNQAVSSWQWIITPVYRWLFNIDNKDDNKWFYRQSDGMAGIKHNIIEDGINYQLISMMPQGQQNMIQAILKTGILMITVVLLIMAAYLLYSLLLAWRIKKLNQALQSVLDDTGKVHIKMPSHSAHDEIGQLSRGIESMLTDVREYTQYLKDLGSRLSHEMKTPLAIVQTSLDNLQLEQQGASSDFLKRAQIGTHRLKFILNQLSEVSQLKYSMENTPKQQLNLTDFCQQLGHSYKEFTPNLRLNITNKPIWINGSTELLAQMLDKVIENAKDFTAKDAHIEFNLSAEKQACLSIINWGSQLPDKPNIFDSLVTIRSKNKNHSHLGLGLYIVQLIARFHKIQISAINHSTPDRVEFKFNFNIIETFA
jgi:signal transduction histidine kinase